MSSIIKPILGSQLELGHYLANGLVGLWLFNEGSGNKVFDLSGNSNHCDLTSVIWKPGKFGPAIYYDGAASFGLITDSAELRVSTNFAISFWISTASLSQSNTYLLARDTDGTAQSSIIYEFVDNQIEFFAVGYSGADPRPNSQIPITDTNWHHIVYNYDGTTWSGYKDGILVFSVARVFALTTVALNGWYVGAAVGPAAFFNGYLDDILIYNNRNLLASEVASLRREPFIMFERNPIELWTAASTAAVGTILPQITSAYMRTLL